MKFFQLNVFFLLFYFCFSSFAYSGDKIALIDLDLILKNSNLGKSILKEIELLNNNNINELKKKEKELKKDEDEIKQKQNIISDEEFQKEVDILKKKVNQYRKLKDKMVKNFEKKRNENLSNFFQKISPIIQDYMDKNSIDILIERKNVFIGKTDSDITNQIIKIVDQNL